MKVSVDTIEITVDKCRIRFCRTYDERVCVMTGYETTERDERPNGAARSLAKEIATRHFGLLESIRIKHWLSKKKKRERAKEVLPLFANLKNAGKK